MIGKHAEMDWLIEITAFLSYLHFGLQGGKVMHWPGTAHSCMLPFIHYVLQWKLFFFKNVLGRVFLCYRVF